MLAARFSRLAHRWLALAIGIQLLLWAASGVYMTAVDLDFIHGDPLVRNLAAPVDVTRVRVTPAEVVAAHPGTQRLALRALPGIDATVYEVQRADGTTLVDAGTGARRVLDEADVARLARAYYAGEGALLRTNYLERNPPIELQSRPLPLWRVDFDDWLETSLYVDPATGRLVTRRHRFWRWFDFLWSLHIMDYEERSDVNNTLLRVATVTSGLFVASGIWLFAYSFRFRRRAPKART